jgi:ABC-2 type transport system permease protein
MTATISAELLRLRTVATHRWVVLGMIALIASNAAPFLTGASTSADEVAAQLRGLAQLALLMVAGYAANVVAEEFRRGSVAMTYLVHPVRARVAAAQSLTYAAAGLLLGAVLAAVAAGIVLPVAAGDGVDAGLSAVDVALVIGGTAFSGAVLGAAGALVGAVARHPGLAIGVVVVWNLSETLLTRGGTRGGVGSYLPSQLTGAATGLSDRVAVIPAMALLLVELAVLALAVRRWALARDLT